MSLMTEQRHQHVSTPKAPMSRAIPSKPPQRPFRPAYAVTTTTRVPGRRPGDTGALARPEELDLTGPPSAPGPAS